MRVRKNVDKPNNPNKSKKPAKVPVILQMEALECGAACLAMILAYHGKWVSLEQVRRDCGVSRDGSKAKNILIAARAYGMEASGYRYEVEKLMQEDIFPCILFWEFNHFVVLDGFTKNGAVLNDPARGVVTVSMEEFDEKFTGVCLRFTPGETFVRDGEPDSIWGFVRQRMKGTMPAVTFTFLTVLISALIGIISPGFTRIFLDRILTQKNPEWTQSFFLIYGIFLLVQIVVSFISTRTSNRLNAKLDAVGNSSYLWKVLRLPMEFFGQRSAGDIYQRQGMNASIANTLIDSFAPMILHIGMLVFYLFVMIRYSVVLSLIGIGSVILNALLARSLSNKRINNTRVQMRDESSLAGNTVTGLEMIETIKASGAETSFFQRLTGIMTRVIIRNEDYTGYVLTLNLLSNLTDVLITMTGVWLIMSGSFTIGMLTAFQGYLSSFLSPASSIISAGQNIQEMRTQMERIEDVMNYPIDVEDEDLDRAEVSVDSAETESDDTTADTEENTAEKNSYRKLSGRLEMRHVTFGYAPLEAPVIRDFSLDLEPGRSVAFVGKSGCGKSTLSKLISGLYRPWEGEILFDGQPIGTINRRVLTGSLAVVDQDIVLFEDTIANNIKMWDESIEDFEMIMAARDAQIHEDIMSRDEGYQHVLLEGGRDFSGGQRQRLEIARVLAQDPTIVILDEATSALDAETEIAVVDAIKARGLTCIVIAHRLSAVRDCDEILVMEEGSVVERGTHEELYAKNGLYTALVSSE